jgi:hypothetical protein
VRYFHLKFWIPWSNLSSCKWPHIIKVWHVLWWLPAKKLCHYYYLVKAANLSF